MSLKYKKGFRSKLSENVLIYSFISNGELNIEKVISEYVPYIYKILRNQAIKLSIEDMEEIISDVFLAVWKNQNKLDINKSMNAYIGGITKNLLKKKIRSSIQHNSIDDYEEILISSSNIYIEYEKNQIIMKELDSMKQEDRDIFKLYYYHSKKIKEISTELNITQSKVKSKLHAIRKKLKKFFEIKEAKSNNEQ